MKYHRYAVLGSNSFAGAAFVARAVSDGAQVIGFNRSAESSPIFLPYRDLESGGRYTFFQADINHDRDVILAQLDKFRPQIVVDFAGQGMVAQSWDNPEQWFKTNVLSKINLLEHLRKEKLIKKYIKISTPEVYGSHSDKIKETFIFNRLF